MLLLLLVVGGVIVNYYMIHSMSERDDEIVMVSLNRLKHELEECENSGRPIPENLSAYEGVRKISALEQTEFTDTEKLNVFFAEQEGYCLMFSTGKTLYKIEYDISTVKGKRTFIATNVIFAVLFLVLLFMYHKLRKNILLTNKIVLNITYNGKYLGYKSYETIEDVPDKYNKYKVTTVYTSRNVALGDTIPSVGLGIGLERVK